MKLLRVLLIIILGGVLLTTSASALDEAMSEEFAYLSGQTVQAMELSITELNGLVALCDLLLEKTTSLKASEKKIFSKKVKRLRGLFVYVVETKQAAVADEPAKE